MTLCVMYLLPEEDTVVAVILNLLNRESDWFYISVSLILVYDGLFVLLLIGRLIAYYLYLSFVNKTFYEHSKTKWNRYPWGNPFKR